MSTIFNTVRFDGSNWVPSSKMTAEEAFKKNKKVSTESKMVFLVAKNGTSWFKPAMRKKKDGTVYYTQHLTKNLSISYADMSKMMKEKRQKQLREGTGKGSSKSKSAIKVEDPNKMSSSNTPKKSKRSAKKSKPNAQSGGSSQQNGRGWLI